MVNAFETDENSNDNLLSVDGTHRSYLVKKVFQTRESRLFVANCREPICLYKCEVLEKTRHSDQRNEDLLAICEAEHRHKESSDIACKGKENKLKIE